MATSSGKRSEKRNNSANTKVYEKDPATLFLHHWQGGREEVEDLGVELSLGKREG